MGTRALVVLILAPSLALAQTAGLVTANPSEVGRANCSTESNVTLSWTGTTTPVATNTWRVAVGSSSCAGTAPASNDASVIVKDQLATAGVASASATVANSGVIVTAGGVTCIAPSAGAAADVTTNVCVWLIAAASSSLAAQGVFTFQLARPPPPVLDGVRAANGALIVDFSRGADSGLDDAVPVKYRVGFYLPTLDPICNPVPPSPVPFDPRCLFLEQEVSGSGARVGGLANGTTYTVYVVAVSSSGNDSGPSGPGTGTPLPFESFWENYQGANGGEQGGCGGGTGALSLLALLPLALRRRRP